MKFPPSFDAPFTRRVFVTLGLLAGAGSVYLLLRQSLSFLFSSTFPEKPHKFAVIASQTLSQSKKTLHFAQGLWLMQDERGWYALINNCTHLGCQPTLDQAAGVLNCPCHGSRFNLQGFPIRGPARRPLFRPYLWLDDKKTLWADTRREVDHSFRIRT